MVQKVRRKQVDVTDGEACIVKQGLGFEDHQTMLLLDTCGTGRQLISLPKQSETVEVQETSFKSNPKQLMSRKPNSILTSIPLNYRQQDKWESLVKRNVTNHPTHFGNDS